MPQQKRAAQRVLAVLVEFAPDNTGLTTGTGRFGELGYSQNYGNTIIEPLPHDRAYFLRKLEFLKNYFETVSDGKTTVTFTVPNRAPYTLAKRMEDYRPARDRLSDAALSNQKLAEFLQDTWATVDAQSPEIDFSQFDAFVVFHAGIGRDINLVASTGVDPQPLDLPSLFFNLTSLKAALGEGFEGFSVDNGAVKITNSAILPETESREVDAIGGKVLLEISINGLLAASFGSYLGLPDLFDTRTGRSGIGRFGLSDGEGIFNYNGILPPEPSAYERILLGWAKPVEVFSIDQTLRLPAQGLHQNSDSVIYKIPITSREYFLIENRNRNAKGLGVTLTRVLSGTASAVSYTEDEDGFSINSTSALDGDIIGSTNYDWTIPAGAVNNLDVQGGVLVWHIDENIIDANRASNTINANAVKGIFLLEADGSQDIGQNYGIVDAGNGTQSGSPLDYFFSGNLSPVYKNFIDGNTFPSTRANSKAETKLRFSDFPTPAPVMTMKLTRGDEFVKVIQTQVFADSFNVHAGIAADIFIPSEGLPTGDYSLLSNSASGIVQTKGLNFSPTLRSGYKPAVALIGFGSQRNFIVTTKDSSVYTQAESNFQPRLTSRNVGSRITTPAVVDTVAKTVTVGTERGDVVTLSLDSLKTLSSQNVSAKKIVYAKTSVSVNTLSPPSLFVAEDKAIFGNNTISLDGRTATAALLKPAPPNASGGVIIDAVPYQVVIVTKEKDLVVIDEGGGKRVMSVPCVNEIKSQPAVADLEHRGELAVIVTADDKIFAYNPQGVMLSNFPITLNSPLPINASPVVADVDGDTFEDIIVQTQDGRLAAYNRFGKNLFTLAIAEGTETTPTVVPSLNNTGLYLFSVDKSGLLQGVELPKGTQNIAWSSLYGDNLNSSVYTPQRTPNFQLVVVNELMPEKSVYNYPNPAKEQTTFRFYLKEAANVSVKVFDLSGMKVWEGSKGGVANSDNELAWSTGNVQSGIYYGIVTATGNSATTTVKLKVAIAK